MDEILDIGTIVQLIDKNGRFFKCMIVENIYKKQTKAKEKLDAQYRGITYPVGFNGELKIHYFEYENIITDYKIVENPGEINISSIIESKEIKYLVIAKNFRYLDREVANEYLCIEFENADINKKVIIKEENIDKVERYSHQDDDLIKFNKNKHQNIVKNLNSFEELLPLGSIVVLSSKEYGDLEVMVVARNVKDRDIFYDYTGVIYELGFRGVDRVLKFQKQHIKDINFLGYFDEKEEDFMLEVLSSRKENDGS